MAIYRGILLAFDDDTYRSTVRIDGSTPRTVTNVRTNRLGASAFVPGRKVLLDTGDHGDPEDAVIVAVYA